MHSTLQPIQKNERIQLLDILRGFAILGIFIMNLESFTFYWALDDTEKAIVPLAAYDHTTEFLLAMLLEGKFYSIFSMLFGIGFAIYLSKADANKAILSLFTRRLAILLLIGFIHLLLWSGDIVAFYAMLGFLLIPFRKFSNRTLLVIAAFCIISPIGWYALKMSNPPVFDLSRHSFELGEKISSRQGINSGKEFFQAMKVADFFDVIRYNIAGIFFRYGDLIFQSRAFKVFGMFLLGLVIGRTKFHNRLQENKRLLWTVLIAGLAVGLPANYLAAHFKETGGYYRLTANGLKYVIAYAFGIAPLALAYASGIALCYLSSAGKKILNIIAPAGKMALTNYIMHTLIGLFVFTGLGLVLNPIGPTAWTIFALCVFVLQIILSTVWFRFFNYGPLEWLWRSATYKKWQPMIKQEKNERSPGR